VSLSPITLAVVPSATPGDSRAALAAVCTELGTLLGTEVRGDNPASYEALIAGMQKDQIQFAWMSPALCVLSERHLRLRPVLSAVRGDRVEYCSALFVHADSPYRAIDQLAGKTVAWVDSTSAAGYLVPRLHLASRGIDPAQFFGAELFLRSHAEVVRAVFDGRAQLGATYSELPRPGSPVDLRSGFRDVAPERKARVLEWTGAIPNDVIAGHGLLSRDEHRVFGNAILTLAERDDGRELLFKAFHTGKFMSTPRNALRPLWNLVELARMHGLLTEL
jgi:phosphate/phosphite/phosphonate ABC transporter binding protein